MRDLKTEIRELIEFGKDCGTLTKMEILDLVRGLIVSDEQMKGFCERIVSMGIEIVDDTEGYYAKLDTETGEHYWSFVQWEELEKYLIIDDRLTSKEKNVLAYRYGLGGGKKHSLEATQKTFGITRERLKQIENKFLSRWCEMTRIIRRIRDRRRLYYNDKKN